MTTASARRPAPTEAKVSPHIQATLEESQQDLLHDRLDDTAEFMAWMRKRIEKRRAV